MGFGSGFGSGLGSGSGVGSGSGLSLSSGLTGSFGLVKSPVVPGASGPLPISTSSTSLGPVGCSGSGKSVS
ncbi:hypothetical protein [Vagococcus salmoninarum]|uniref:hypothetical protein n=1 Tax=Vagococcus salmoninarum TaxID=2739 RepID=UPI003F9C6AC2